MGTADDRRGDGVTIVTAYVETGWRTREQYLEWLRPMLALPCPMQIFVEPQTAEFVRQARGDLPTVVRAQDWAEVPKAPDLDRMAEILRNGGGGGRGPENDNPRYLAAIWSKFAWLAAAARENPFDSRWFFWLDAGFSRFWSDFARPLPEPEKADFLRWAKDRLLVLRHDEMAAQVDCAADGYLRDTRVVVPGVMFGGTAAAIERTAIAMESICKNMLAEGYVRTEEVALSHLLAREPQDFCALPSKNGYTALFDAIAETEHSQTISAYKKLLRAPCAPPAGLAGDGVIYAMFENNARADLGVLIGMQMLRDAGWQGRIQFWHVGHAPKIDPAWDVEVFDTREVQQRAGVEVYSWGLKGFAIEHSGLARAMWLDWDAYVCTDPTPLFAELERTDFYYWRNGQFWDQFMNHRVFPGLDLGPSVQGGMFLLNCQTELGWRLLQAQRFYDTHWQTFWTPRSDDQGGWSVALAAGTARGHCNLDNPWRDAWLAHHRGAPAIVHRCNDKLWSHCLPTWYEGLPYEARVRELYERFRREGGYNPEGRVCNQPAEPVELVGTTREQRVQALRDRARADRAQQEAAAKRRSGHEATMARKAICAACPFFRQGQVHIETWCSLADERPGQGHDCEHGRFSRWTARLTNLEAGTCPTARWPA